MLVYVCACVYVRACVSVVLQTYSQALLNARTIGLEGVERVELLGGGNSGDGGDDGDNRETHG